MRKRFLHFTFERESQWMVVLCVVIPLLGTLLPSRFGTPVRADLLVSGTTTLNICSQVGLITLVGLVSKNGILIMHFSRVLEQARTRRGMLMRARHGPSGRLHHQHR
jgi:multidrug efflux pump subunit AcrB